MSKSILAEAAEIRAGERAADYGDAVENFRAIADIATLLTGRVISPDECCVVLTAGRPGLGGWYTKNSVAIRRIQFDEQHVPVGFVPNSSVYTSDNIALAARGIRKFFRFAASRNVGSNGKSVLYCLPVISPVYFLTDQYGQCD